LVDQLQRDLDKIETTWPMRGSYARIDPYILDVTEAGIRFRFLVFTRESHAWYGDRRAETGLLQVAELGRPRHGDVVFDFGANAGFMATWYALRVGAAGAVHAFEPCPWYALACRYQARLNYIENLHVHAVGIGASRRTIRVPLTASQTREMTGPDQEFGEVEIRALTEYADLKPTFIKMDIEGAEMEVAPLLPRLPTLQALFLELHPVMIRERGGEPLAVLRAIQAAGLEIVADNVLTEPLAPNALHDAAHQYICARPADLTALRKTRMTPIWSYFAEYSRYHLDRGEVDEALDYARSGLAAHPDKPELLRPLAAALLRNGDIAEAMDAARRVAELSPGNAHATFFASWLLSQTGHTEQSIMLARQAINLDSTVAAFWHHLGYQLNELGDREEARKAIEQALRLEPGNAEFQRLHRKLISTPRQTAA
jgi:FkbM family methyltransferase